MQERKVVIAFIIGIAAIFIIKYVIFGLEIWDNNLHPERLEVDLNGPLKKFSKPFLGIFSIGKKV